MHWAASPARRVIFYSEHLKLRIVDATGWVMAHLNTPKEIFDICSGNGVTSTMLGDIVQSEFPDIIVTGVVVNEWLAGQGLPTLA